GSAIAEGGISANKPSARQRPDNGCSDGLRNMRQRVEELGGEFNLESKSASGTCLAIMVPLIHHK
ncbi:MAG TPA: hypothetical protein VN516_10360, partial [Candidatus Baltobacteraceae bacterium]|nr:hypothetical protein [Candidatus Baltobacteraceae bacterium]